MRFVFSFKARGWGFCGVYVKRSRPKRSRNASAAVAWGEPLALVADKHGRTGDEFTDLVLALAAERAMEHGSHTIEKHPRAGAKGGGGPASSIIEEASENP
jgi:hypothetical protein